jgi:hypothetical protein
VWRRRGFALAAWLVLISAGGCSRSMEKEIGEEAWTVVGAADQVEVLRLSYGADLSSLKPGAPFFGANPVGKPVVPPSEWTDELRALLRNPEGFEWEAAKGCLPTPGVAVRFTSGGRQADLLLCFECRLLALGMTPAAGGGPPQQWLDFEHSRAAFVRLAKQALPSDKEIQALPE